MNNLNQQTRFGGFFITLEKVMRPQDFYTRTKSSRGVRVDLADPAGNREWMRVRSVLSPEFMAAAAAIASRAEEYSSILAAAERIERKSMLRLRRSALAAALIADWSLPLKEQSEIVELLTSNPRLRRQIEQISENHALHFGVDE